ncbi:MAG: DNA glycosylase AlkZ-like family protein [Myxococcota bacterium]
MTLTDVRARWAQGQGLTGRAVMTPVECLRRFGWMVVTGGCGPYLSMYARVEGFRREALDAAVEAGAIVLVQTMRGGTMLVPAEDAPLARAAGAALEEKRESQLLRRCKVEDSELVELGAEVRSLLPATTERIEAALPGRDLGDAGKAFGYHTTLPAALRRMEARGEVVRVPTGGRVDAATFEWRAGEGRSVKLDPVELGRRFFRWAGPATRNEFAEWAGIGVREADAAIRALGLAPVKVEGLGEAWDAGAAPGEGQTRFLPFRDNWLYFRRSPSVLVRPAHHAVPVHAWGKGLRPVRDAESIHMHTISAGGELVGAWEYDRSDVRIRTFEPTTLGPEREAVTAFVRGELGHSRIYPADTLTEERLAWIQRQVRVPA